VTASEIIAAAALLVTLASIVWRGRTHGLQTCQAHDNCRNEMEKKLDALASTKADRSGLSEAFREHRRLEEKVAGLAQDLAVTMAKLDSVLEALDRIEILVSQLAGNTPRPIMPLPRQRTKPPRPSNDDSEKE
jgi:hypothetical protein